MGRGRVILSLLALALFFAPPTIHAQEPPSPVLAPAREARALDASGDVRVTAAGTALPPPGGNFDYLDLLEVWISNETLTELEFGVRLKSLQQLAPDAAAGLGRDVRIQFDLEDVHYTIIDAPDAKAICRETATIYRQSPGLTSTDCVGTVEADPIAGTLRFLIPRLAITNQSENFFDAGDVLMGLRAVTSTQNPPTILDSPPDEFPRLTDRVPDSGADGPSYASILGSSVSTGPLHLFSRTPVRVSNGESTTLVFPLNLTNEGDQDALVLLEASGAEDGWGLRVPARLRVPAGGQVNFPAILSMGFTHRHGEMATFQVTAEDAADRKSLTTITLGIFWTDVPQPAGHHPQLWLHSDSPYFGPGFSLGLGTNFCVEQTRDWMSTLATEDPASPDEPIPPCEWPPFDEPYQVDSPTETWYFPLEPALIIGLDFDLRQAGLFRTAIQSQLSASQATLLAQVHYCPGSDVLDCEEKLVLAAEGRSDPIPLAGNGAATAFEFPILARPEADLLPFRAQSSLALTVVLETERTVDPYAVTSRQTSPVLLPKSSLLQLPLVEYHDPIDQQFQGVGSLRVLARSPFEQPVNPGRTASFSFEVHNAASMPHNVRLSLEGFNKGWAAFGDDASFRLEPAKSSTIDVLVEAPIDSLEGQRAELFLVAESADDPNVVAISRLRAAVVDAATDVPDIGSENSDDAAGVPSVPAMLVATVLLAATLCRRRSA